ncbi:hypothetical protein [Burkholderia dolosa]|uniref:hypothetical protein n=1 Tax=Burkholderia dolosa TaxID=152500 RepID=UPI001B9A2FBC|nr:hypothetical protein [Burkholderia dolosa]MBR8059223.1 hypothetical protein [Burkholderia dolosa]
MPLARIICCMITSGTSFHPARIASGSLPEGREPVIIARRRIRVLVSERDCAVDCLARQLARKLNLLGRHRLANLGFRLRSFRPRLTGRCGAGFERFDSGEDRIIGARPLGDVDAKEFTDNVCEPRAGFFEPVTLFARTRKIVLGFDAVRASAARACQPAHGDCTHGFL